MRRHSRLTLVEVTVPNLATVIYFPFFVTGAFHVMCIYSQGGGLDVMQNTSMTPSGLECLKPSLVETVEEAK